MPNKFEGVTPPQGDGEKKLNLLEALNQSMNFGHSESSYWASQNQPSIGIINGYLNYYCPKMKRFCSIMEVGHLVKATRVGWDPHEHESTIETTGDTGKIKIVIPETYNIEEIIDEIKNAEGTPPDWLEKILFSLNKYQKEVKDLNPQDEKVALFYKKMEDEIKSIVLSLDYEFVKH